MCRYPFTQLYGLHWNIMSMARQQLLNLINLRLRHFNVRHIVQSNAVLHSHLKITKYRCERNDICDLL